MILFFAIKKGPRTAFGGTENFMVFTKKSSKKDFV